MTQQLFYTALLLALASLLVWGQDPQPVTTKLVCETSFTIPAHDSKTCTLERPAGFSKVRLTGQFTATGGPGITVDVWVMNDPQFTNWQQQHSLSAMYRSQKVAQGTINVFLVNPGKYHVVFNSDTSPTTIKANLTLRLIR